MEQMKCTYCKPHQSATKYCVPCNDPVCDRHIIRHISNEKNEHALIDPNIPKEEWQCFQHEELLEYYCTNDSTAICKICYKSGKHKEHQVEDLEDFAKKKKESLKQDIEKLKFKYAQKQEQITAQKKKVEEASETAIIQLHNMKVQLQNLVSKVSSEIERIRNVPKSVNEQDCNLDRKEKRQHQRNLKLLEDLCKKNDYTFLKELKGVDDTWIHDDNPTSFEETEIQETLHKEFLHFADGLIEHLIKNSFPKIKKTKITLDVQTAYYKINVTENFSVASQKGKPIKKEAGLKRFRTPHVLSTESFSSGSHYWEVEMKGKQCRFGVAYDCIDQMSMRMDSCIGYNRESWSLSVDDMPGVWHHYTQTKIQMDPSVRSFRIFLEYEAGRLSFYQLCDPIKHLHTFTTTFTKPLHAAFYVGEKSQIKILN